MADAVNSHPTAGRRRRDKGPPFMVPLAPGALPRLERVNDTESDCPVVAPMVMPEKKMQSDKSQSLQLPSPHQAECPMSTMH